MDILTTAVEIVVVQRPDAVTVFLNCDVAVIVNRSVVPLAVPLGMNIRLIRYMVLSAANVGVTVMGPAAISDASSTPLRLASRKICGVQFCDDVTVRSKMSVPLPVLVTRTA